MKYIKVCQCCGKKFTAQKSSTRYCSKYCNDRYLKMKRRGSPVLGYEQPEAKEDTHEPPMLEEVFSPYGAAQYLGTSDSTIYRYINQGVLPVIHLTHATRIRKSELDGLHRHPMPYGKTLLNLKKKDDYLSVREIAEKYRLSYSRTYKTLSESDLRPVVSKNVSYYDRKAVDGLFAGMDVEEQKGISEWVSREYIQEKYHLTEAKVYSLAFAYRLPRKREGRFTLYSRIHVEAALGDHDALLNDYYSVEDVMEKYSLSRDQVYWRLRKGRIDRFMVGRTVKFRRDDFDVLMKDTIDDD